MKRPIVIWIFFTLLVSIAGKLAFERHNFSVTCSIYHYQSADKITIKVSYDSVLATDYCGTPNCKDSFQYFKVLTPQQAQDYYLFIKSLRLDTLEDSYLSYVSDGSAVAINVNGDSLPSKSISIIKYHHPPIAIDKLITETMKFLQKKKKWVMKQN